MEIFLRELNRIFQYDPGRRGLLGYLPEPDLPGLGAELAKAERTIITTGFPILSEEKGETDGPAGAVNIARVLELFGKATCIITDQCSYEIVKAAACAYGLKAELHLVPAENGADYCKTLLADFRPTHVIAIERPGKIGGKYRNMHGQSICRLVGDTDSLFREFRGVKIGVGDGGNELGMGSLRPYFADRDLAVADEACDYALVAGVSNWWGWGIAAIISIFSGRNLLPSHEEEERLLRNMVAAGAIDGITKAPQMSVDGISFQDNMAVLDEIAAITEAGLKRQGVKAYGL